MRKMTALAAATVIALHGCASAPDALTTQQAPKTTGIGHSRNDWRVCVEDDTCPKPTPKTVLIAVPQPRIDPQVEKPVAPEPKKVERRFSINFEFAKAMPTHHGFKELEKLLSDINKDDAIRIEGYTDDVGTKEFNDRLARKRAEFVAAWLKRHGVSNQIELEARGKCCYAATNESEEGRATNRRTVVVLKANRGIPETTSTIRKETVR